MEEEEAAFKAKISQSITSEKETLERDAEIVDNSKYIFDSTGNSLAVKDVVTKSARKIQNSQFGN